MLQISAYNTSKERFSKDISNDETSLPTSDVPHLYLDKTLDLEIGETKPESKGDLILGNEPAKGKANFSDNNSKQYTNRKSGDIETVLRNGNSVSKDDPRNSSSNGKTTSENIPVKGICW